jgi:hypothetical protein
MLVWVKLETFLNPIKTNNSSFFSSPKSTTEERKEPMSPLSDVEEDAEGS